MTPVVTISSTMDIDFEQCSDAGSDDDYDLSDMPRASEPDTLGDNVNSPIPTEYGEYDGYFAPWMYAMRKYVRRDDADYLLGLIRQYNISLDCRPYFCEVSNNEACDLTLEILDSWAHSISVRDFINGTPGPEGQVLKCLIGRVSTKCQTAILGLN